jgi:hypothetical protein
LSNYSSRTADLLQKLEFAKELKEKLNIDGQDNKEVNNWVDNLSEEDLVVAASISFDEGTTLESFKAAFNIAKQQAEIEKIQIKIDTTTDLLDTLSQGKELSEEQQKSLKDLESEYSSLANIRDKTSEE